MKKLTVQGFVLIDVDVATLNNAGKKTGGSNDENGVSVKKITKNGKSYPYVSGQAWRYWWRETLRINHNWIVSPLTKIAGKNQVLTEANPVVYADDDVFGYVSATKDLKFTEDGTPVMNKKGVQESESATVTRVSPLKNSALVAVASTGTVAHFSVAARHEGDPVPYTKEEYSAVMKGMFSLDVSQVGTFSSYNKTGFKNLSQPRREEAIAAGAIEIEDTSVRDPKSAAKTLVRLPEANRLKRSQDAILSLKTLSGGAMQASNMADVTPKFIVLAATNSGNHPFSHIASEERKGAYGYEAKLNIDALREVLMDYQKQIIGTVFIGKRLGFMDETNTALKALAEELSNIQVLPVNEAIDKFCQQLETQIENS